MTACYIDKSVYPVWLAEHQAHYLKHATSLARHLAEDEIAEVRKVFQIEADTQSCEPPSRDFARALAANTKVPTSPESVSTCVTA
ncbi:MAG: hypothetical protein ABL931_03550 [Usitatibacteraceae bacterium]